MGTRTRLLLLLSGFALAAPATAGAEISVRGAAERFVPGEALVRFEHGVAAAERRDTRGDADVSFEQALKLPGTQIVTFDGSVRDAIDRLEAQPGVADAQPNYRYHALAAPPNDTHFPSLWGLQPAPGVGALAAWDRTRGAGQIIAVLDTGVDLTHPDLAGNLWTGPGGIHGHDFVHNDSDPSDHQYHGTHVAGSAAAIAGNGQGVAGVAPEADIMAVRVLNGDGGGSTSTLTNGILFASANGAGVINLSLGGPGSGDAAMADAATVAEQRGSVIVAAAGNGGGDGVGDNNDATPQLPCNLPNPNIICVAALDDAGGLASYSNFGPANVDVGAPGGDPTQGGGKEILSAKPAWAAPLLTEDFEAIAGEWTATATSGLAWGLEGAAGARFATDSPGANYVNNTDSTLSTTSPVSLAGRQGCRMHFDVALSTEPPDPSTGAFYDFLTVGANGVGQSFSGSTGGFFQPVELTISELDGQPITPALEFESDGSIVANGAAVDDLRVICRGSDYDNDIVGADDFELPPSTGGSYMAISGTSMATPHVAGVAALVRAFDTGAPPAQVVQALKNGVTPLASLAGKTSTGGAVNAVPAMDAALALPNPGPPPPPPPPPAIPPRKPQIARVTVNNRGVVTMIVRGEAGTRGLATLTANIRRASATRVRNVGRRSFRIGARRRATVRLRLTRPAISQLRRNRRLPVRARVVLTNAAGLRSPAATARFRITQRRR